MFLLTWATSLSLVFFVLIDIKNAAGKIRHMITPIVDPTIPKTNSILGIKTPTINEVTTIKVVRHLNLVSVM